MADFVLNQSGQQIQDDLDLLDSNNATQGQVLTADGQGGASWQNGGGGTPANMMTTNTSQTVTGEKTWETVEPTEDGERTLSNIINSGGISLVDELDDTQHNINSCDIAPDSIYISFSEFGDNGSQTDVEIAQFDSSFDNYGVRTTSRQLEEQDPDTEMYTVAIEENFGMDASNKEIVYSGTVTELSSDNTLVSKTFIINAAENSIVMEDFNQSEGTDVSTTIMFSHRDYDNGGSTEEVAYLSDFNIPLEGSYVCGNYPDNGNYKISFTMNDNTSGTYQLIRSNGQTVVSGDYSLGNNLITFTDSNDQTIGQGTVNNNMIVAAFKSTIANGALVSPQIFCTFINMPPIE